ncbi:MAG: oligosaccharide flippase family protein, partial [Gammaproteobacteria bacterium]
MKRGELATIWKHGRVYSVANVLNRVAGLVLLPVYLHVLQPAEYGLLAVVTLTADVLGVVLGLGLGRALLRLYVGAADETARD